MDFQNVFILLLSLIFKIILRVIYSSNFWEETENDWSTLKFFGFEWQFVYCKNDANKINVNVCPGGIGIDREIGIKVFNFISINRDESTQFLIETESLHIW